MAENEWFLLKYQDKQVYGPVPIDELRSWAVAAKVSPMDKVSNDDQQSWVRAPMVAALQMDWLIELDGDYLYGPTSLATIQEFIESGEISAGDKIINCLTNDRMKVEECRTFTHIFAEPEDSEVSPRDREKHVRRLEGQIEQLRHDLTKSEQRYKRLRAQFLEETGKNPS